MAIYRVQRLFSDKKNKNKERTKRMVKNALVMAPVAAVTAPLILAGGAKAGNKAFPKSKMFKSLPTRKDYIEAAGGGLFLGGPAIGAGLGYQGYDLTKPTKGPQK